MGLGVLERPAVVGFENIGDGDHLVERLTAVAVALTGGALPVQAYARVESL